VAASTLSEGKSPPAKLRIGAWQVDSARNEVSRGTESVRLEPKVIEVLTQLASRPGEVISRDDLLAAVWPGVIVGDDALTQAIIKLRKALGDDAHKPTYIETISKRGYRLIAPVEELGSSRSAASAGERRLAAILSADIAGYSRLMGEDEAETVKALKAHQQQVLPLVARFGGRVIDLAGDGVLAEFPSAVGAVQCAVEIQRVMTEANAAVARSRRLQFRIGVNVGDVIHDGDRIYGDGINIAARLQALAPPAGLLVSQGVLEQVRNKVAERFVNLGAVSLKNIREPVVAHLAVLPSSRQRPAWLERWSFALRTGKRMPIAAAALVLLAGVGVAVALIMGSVRMPWPIAPDTRGAARSSIPTVAILPLANLSGDAKREYFSDGVTEDLIDALGRFSGVRVMSRNAVLGFKGKAATPQAVREELGVTYIVQGSLREADGKLRIALELSDAGKGVLIWSERYDADGAQLFAVQDRIARTLVSTLQIRLTEAERERVFNKPTESLEAYDLVLRARALLDPLDRRMNREARVLLARAQEIAPDYADASTALGEAELDRARFGWVADPDAASARAEANAKRALESPDQRSHPRAHSLLAAIYGYQSRHAEALSHTQRAIELNPSDSVAQYRHGEALLHLGRIDEAIVPLELARRLEPRAVRINLALAYYLAGRYTETIAVADSLLARRHDHVALHAARAAALAQLGRIEEAREEADQVRRYSPTFDAEQWVTRMAPEYTSKVHEGLRKAGL